MSIDQDLVSKKLDFLNNQIHKIEGMSFDEQTFTKDEDIHDDLKKFGSEILKYLETSEQVP